MDDIRTEILGYIDERLHRAVMLAEPHRTSEDHRHRLVALQAARLSELRRLQRCESAQEVASSFLERARSGALNEVELNAEVLGLPTMLQIVSDVRARARQLGLLSDEPLAAEASIEGARSGGLYEAAQPAPGGLERCDDPRERQNLLLDEALEESFPASDSPSVIRLSLGEAA